MENKKEKKPIKQCRVKADTCFKWHCLGKLFELDLEDIGLMYLISQLKDDEGNVRYNLIEDELIDMFKEKEQEWLKIHAEKIKTSAVYRIAFADLNGQRKATTGHYKKEVERRAAYNAKLAAQQEHDDDDEETVVTGENDNKAFAEWKNGKVFFSVQAMDEISKVGLNPDQVESYMTEQKRFAQGKHDIKTILDDIGVGE